MKSWSATACRDLLIAPERKAALLRDCAIGGPILRTSLPGAITSHTLVTELAELGADDEVIMSIAGHVSRAMLSRYSHVRMEAKRRALDEIAARQRAADEKRKVESQRREQVAAVSQAPLVQ